MRCFLGVLQLPVLAECRQLSFLLHERPTFSVRWTYLAFLSGLDGFCENFVNCDTAFFNSCVARSSSLNLFSSISKFTKVLHLLVCGRCCLNNLSLKIALPARVNKVLREFAGKDLVNCYEVV